MRKTPCLAALALLAPAALAQTHVGLIPTPGDVGHFGESVDFLTGTGSLVIIGSPLDDTGGESAGRAYVMTAQDALVQQAWIGSPHSRFGSTVAELGDVTGDGVPEVLVGAPEGAPGSQPAGVIHVYEISGSSPHYSIPGAAADERIGGRLDGLGDVNGDGLADWLGGSLWAGGVRVYDGGTGAVIHDATGQQGFFNASGAGDFDGDGIGDYVYSTTTGIVFPVPKVEVRSGLDGSVLRVWKDGELQTSLTGAFGWHTEITGGTVIGDANADGVLDVAVGLPGEDDPATNAGRVSIFSGADGSELHRILGTYANQGFGATVSEAGDLNADGFDDVLEISYAPGTGMPVPIRGYSGRSGQALLVKLPNDGGILTSIQHKALAPAPDLTGDGRPEFLHGSSDHEMVRVYSPIDLELHSDVDTPYGGTQPLELNAGPSHAGEFYLVVGSLTGTQPGTALGGLHLPLNPDVYTTYSATHPNLAPLVSTFGTLDASGRAAASINFIPELAGFVLHHAYVTIAPSGALTSTSNALPVRMFVQ